MLPQRLERVDVRVDRQPVKIFGRHHPSLAGLRRLACPIEFILSKC
jgi:hypothetical protein